MRKRLGLILTLALGTAALGCGNGYSEDEAEEVCDALVNNIDTSTSTAYQDCVACYKDCGDDCAILESYPPQFSCD